MSLDILITTTASDEKQRLHESIRQKQEELELLTKKVEDLRWSLREVKKMYMERIGRLYLDLDGIDIEISIYREIERLISTGKTLEEAKHILKEQQEARRQRLEEEKARLEEEVLIIGNKQHLPKPDLTKIKQLFRTLIMKYHPDLAQDKEEKKHREKMMRYINKAYEENDIKTLTRIQEEQMVSDYEHSSVEFLKNKLIEYFGIIETQTKEYKELMSSEWNKWKKKIIKAKKEKSDPFADLETHIKESLRMKAAVLSDLKATYDTR
jgi:hypothetical protein